MYRHRGGITRRDFIKAGTLGIAGLSMSDLIRMPAAHGAREPAARSVILLWMDGGPSPYETFDPKPGAPLDIRGPFGAIPSNVAGIQVCELMPRMAKQMDKVALLRTLTHDEVTHERACRSLRVDLGRGVFTTEITEVTEKRRFFGDDPSSVARAEPESVQDAYGRTAIGKNCLRARRLVEEGAHFVTVTHGGWDTHSDNFASCENALVPPMDQAFAALLRDLYDRGLLATTLVVWMGEFGRSPEVNAQAGRDHWPRTGCAVFAGAGVPGGQVIGETDATGAEPKGRAISPEEVARTITHKLGIDPVKIKGGGEVIRGLI